MERHRSKYLYYNENIDIYIQNKCREYQVDIEYVENLDNCASVLLLYKNKKIFLINKDLMRKQQHFSILHEFSHIDLGFIGESYEKKESKDIIEKIVNVHMIIKNREIVRGCIIFLVFLALVSEKLLIEHIRFYGE